MKATVRREESAPTENSKAMGIFSPIQLSRFAVRRNFTPKAHHFPLAENITRRRRISLCNPPQGAVAPRWTAKRWMRCGIAKIRRKRKASFFRSTQNILSLRRKAKLHAEGASLSARGKHHSPQANFTVQPAAGRGCTFFMR